MPRVTLLVVCARTRGEIERVKSTIEDWLRMRGLALHPEKTRIVHIDEGFNFLGFFVRRYKGKCLIRPQKEKVLALLQRITQWLRNHQQVPTDEVIRFLNPILRGWSNFYRNVVSKETFSYVSHRIWQMLWRWCLRRHRNKRKDWVYRKYFRTDHNRSWMFHGNFTDSKGAKKRIYLFDISSVVITRHVKVRASASPDDPLRRQYWQDRVINVMLYPKRCYIEGLSRLPGNWHGRFLGE